MDEIIATAINYAKKASLLGEVPVAAVVFDSKSNNIISIAHNLVETLRDPTAHAEMLAIRESCQKTNHKYLQDLSIFVTLEPCAMCMQAICFAQLKTVYFGAYDYKKGALSTNSGIVSAHMNNHIPEIYGGFKEQICGDMITNFFKSIRNS